MGIITCKSCSLLLSSAGANKTPSSDILKIDVEFAEFAAMTSLLTHTASQMQAFPIGQMLMEIHLFGNEAKKREPHTLGQFLHWWESMEERGVRPTWTEPNLLAVTIGLKDKMPRLAEVGPNLQW
tara:strand:- start:178 stop:552 length:375 start_codon:yes stop_codon:yes gene_type:complete